MQLLEKGDDVHYMNVNKDLEGSALHEAAQRGHEAMVELLLQCKYALPCTEDFSKTRFCLLCVLSRIFMFFAESMTQ